LEEICP